MVQNCEEGEKYSSSDHKIIRTYLQMVLPKVANQSRKVYMYSKGRYAEMDKAVSDLDWPSIFKKQQTINQK